MALFEFLTLTALVFPNVQVSGAQSSDGQSSGLPSSDGQLRELADVRLTFRHQRKCDERRHPDFPVGEVGGVGFVQVHVFVPANTTVAATVYNFCFLFLKIFPGCKEYLINDQYVVVVVDVVAVAVAVVVAAVVVAAVEITMSPSEVHSKVMRLDPFSWHSED